MAGLPRGLIVALALVGGMLLIILSNPPHTPCDAQIEIFKQDQKRNLFTTQVKGIPQSAKMRAAEKLCRETNSAGGCFELFRSLRSFHQALQAMPEQCGEKLIEVSEVTAALLRNLSLMVRLAWGSRPPASYYDRNGWLEPPDLALFCALTQAQIRLQGEEFWRQFREKTMNELPGAGELSRDELWKRSLFSTDCRTYL